MRNSIRVSTQTYAVALAGLLLGGPALADPPLTGANLNTPENAASALIGGSTQGIIHAGTPAQLGTSIINGFDGSGNLKSGLGFEVAPLLFIATNSETPWITPDEYRADPWIRMLARTSISVATAKGQGSAGNPISLGFGFTTTLFDWSDPALDSQAAPGDKNNGCIFNEQEEIKKQVEAATDALGPTPTDAQKAVLKDATSAIIDGHNGAIAKCYKKAAIRLWNRSAWNFSFADAMQSATGAVGELKQQSYAFNTAFAWGFDSLQLQPADMSYWQHQSWFYKNSQLLFGAQYVNGQLVADPAKKGTFFAQNSWQFGTQFRTRLFSASTQDDADGIASSDSPFSFKNTLMSLEFVYIANDPGGGRPRNDEMTLTLGAELAITASTYLDFGIGEDRKESGHSTAGFALTQLKYNLANSSSLFQ
jgi:hypothetical protein